MAQKTIFELDLVRIGKWHQRGTRLAITLFLTYIVFIVMELNGIGAPSVMSSISWGVYFVSLVLMIVFNIGISRACGSSVFAVVCYALASIMLSFLLLLVIVGRAGTILRLAGAKPGFLGISRDEWEKLRPGHCRGCGYSRDGLELLQECPECTRVPQVI